MLLSKKNLILLAVLFYSQLYSQVDTSSTTWMLDRTDNIGGFNTSKLTELPVVVETGQDKSLWFDGVNRALLVKGNPIGSSKAFTIEIVFRPDTASAIANKEQRYLHIRSSANDNRRIMMELRILSKMRWTVDTYIKSEASNCTLVDDTTKTTFFSHPIGPWYHVALVYENGIMKHFINGVEELSGQVTYVPIDNGQISIGARQDPRSWFKGAIKKIKFTRRALAPSEFMKMETTGINKNSTTPIGYRLDQNYPNPFNPETTIQYVIPNGAKESFGSASPKQSGTRNDNLHVTLKVFDILGKEVATLVDEFKDPGTYNSKLNVQNYHLSSSIYYYQLKAGDFIGAKKLVLMK